MVLPVKTKILHEVSDMFQLLGLSRFPRLAAAVALGLISASVAFADTTLVCRVSYKDASPTKSTAKTPTPRTATIVPGQTVPAVPTPGTSTTPASVTQPKAPEISIQTVTVQFKNEFVRIETSDGLATLYNANRLRCIVIDKAKKSYYVKHSIGADLDNPLMSLMQLDCHINIAPSTAAASKTIAGDPADHNSVTGTLSVTLVNSQILSALLPSSFSNKTQEPLNIKGELWTSHSIDLPTRDRYLLLPYIYEAAFGGKTVTNSIEKIIAAKISTEMLAKTRELGKLPLSSDITVSSSEINRESTYDVESISTADIDNSVFEIPNNYTQIDPPVTQ
jgi:hypothetical protein